MKQIIFKNPRIKARKEKFGGIIKTDKGIFIIEENAFKFLSSFYEKEERLIEEKEILKELLNINALIKINKEDAICIKTKMK